MLAFCRVPRHFAGMKTIGRRYLPGIAWFLLLAAGMALLHRAPRVEPARALPAHWTLPPALGDWSGAALYYSTDPEVTRPFRAADIVEPGVCPVSGQPLDTVSPAERRLLPADVKIERKIYRHNVNGAERTVIMLVSGASREGIHRPEWCLTAQGFQPGERRILQATDADGAPFSFAVYPVLPRQAPATFTTRHYFLYWYAGPQRKTPHNAERILRMGWDRLRYGRIQRWAYFSIQLTLTFAENRDPDPILVQAAEWLEHGLRAAPVAMADAGCAPE
jgi:hypothetical protein